MIVRSLRKPRSCPTSCANRLIHSQNQQDHHPQLPASGASDTRKQIVFSGIQPTGIPHLGNYLGALQQWKKQQDGAHGDTTNIFSLVDLHAITVNQNPSQLRSWRLQSLAVLLAIGLDPTKSTIFFQSSVSAHSELMWILSCTASVGYLSRMTQWKSKMKVEDNAKPFDTPLRLGLFSYPVLQAADILVYGATHVPVGEDQAQHLEFARNCASAFNHIYGDILVEPETVLSPARRIMSLTSPTKKMSKSDTNDMSRILITDDAATITKKVKKAVTDSDDRITFNPETRPGLANLLQILFYAEGRDDTPNQLANELDGSSKRVIKERLAHAVNELLEPVREAYNQLVTREDYLHEVAQEGARKASASAEKTLGLVKTAVGFG